MKKKFKIKTVNELSKKGINECLSDSEIDHICDTTDLCEEDNGTYEIVDLEDLHDKMYHLRLEQENDRNLVLYFNRQVEIRALEIERLNQKINSVELEPYQ